MLRIHYLQQWFCQSDPAMEEALHDTPLFREFPEIGQGVVRLPATTPAPTFCKKLAIMRLHLAGFGQRVA